MHCPHLQKRFASGVVVRTAARVHREIQNRCKGAFLVRGAKFALFDNWLRCTLRIVQPWNTWHNIRRSRATELLRAIFGRAGEQEREMACSGSDHVSTTPTRSSRREGSELRPGCCNRTSRNRNSRVVEGHSRADRIRRRGRKWQRDRTGAFLRLGTSTHSRVAKLRIEFQSPRHAQ